MDLQFTLQGNFIISHFPNLPKHRRRIRPFLCSMKGEKQKATHSAMVGRWQVLTVVYYPAPVTPILRQSHIVTCHSILL